MGQGVYTLEGKSMQVIRTHNVRAPPGSYSLTGKSIDILRGLVIQPSNYGTELITNGDFSAWTGDNPDNWTVTENNVETFVEEDSGKCRLRSTDGTTVGIYQSGILEVGKPYQVSFDIVSVTSGSLKLGTDNAASNIASGLTAIQTHTFNFVATQSTIRFYRTTGS